MKTELLKTGIRYNAIYIESGILNPKSQMSASATTFWANMSRLGYTAEESLVQAVNGLMPKQLVEIYEAFTDVLQVKNNWAPLAKQWDIPTGETRIDHILTFFYNLFNIDKGTKLACGHIIPDNTFPLERYNGCPFCGTQFETASVETSGQGSKLKVLRLWSETEMESLLSDLLQSKAALDATQVNTLKTLLANYKLPAVAIGIKETLVLLIDILVVSGKAKEAGDLFTNPVDIMRYLWYKKTGFLQIIEPKTLIKRIRKNNKNLIVSLDNSGQVKIKSKEELELKYTRAECKMVAEWLNAITLSAEKCCEQMHHKRMMWVRFIRALRLAEYAKKDGFAKLKEVLDRFYREDYTVFNAEVNQYRLKYDAANTFALLKQRPGLFARSLFSNMLWFGAQDTITAFLDVADQLPARLVLTLNSYARHYFNPKQERTVKALGGINKTVKPNYLLKVYEDSQLKDMITQVEEMCLAVMEKRFAKMENKNKTIFIEEGLFNIPLSIGDRSETVADLPAALMGTRFKLEGDTIRLFMQWGKGLKAQHLDMDLSCQISFANSTETCAFNNLVATGTKHSGDIRQIPDMLGTAEYIEIDIEKLQSANAKYVTFTCNAYSNGGIAPNLVLGWMDSKYPMKISEKTGVAYDPSCVQHQLRVTKSVTKGIVFGVLEVAKKEIVWMEVPFGGQVTGMLDLKNVEGMMAKLKSKITVGGLLQLKAKAQGLIIVDNLDEADEKYNMNWAMNTAMVTQLLID